MGSVPVFQNPYGLNGNSPSQIDKVVGTAYEVVREVAENLEYIKHISAHLSQIYRVYQSIDAIDTIYINIDELMQIYNNIGPIIAHGASTVIVSPVAPTGPFLQGHMWWNSTNANLYMRYNDGDSEQWVQVNTSLLLGNNDTFTNVTSLYYIATANQTVFPLTTPDRFGKVGSFTPTSTIHTVNNGVRLTPTADFTAASNTITLIAPATVGKSVAIDIWDTV